MNRHTVEVVISGAEVSPERVALLDLVDVLARIDKLISSYTVAAKGELPAGSVLSLIDIESGSENLVFSVAESLLPAWVEISRAVEEKSLAGLPNETHKELWSLSQSLERRGWGLEIRKDTKLGISRALIGVATDLAPPDEPVLIRGTTSLHGRCLRVGGATRHKAEIRLATNNKILNAELSEDTAKELATRLYEEVVLEGQATWNAKTWEIVDFLVSAVTHYRAREPTNAFDELAKAAEGRWEGVDATEFIDGLRSDD